MSDPYYAPIRRAVREAIVGLLEEASGDRLDALALRFAFCTRKRFVAFPAREVEAVTHSDACMAIARGLGVYECICGASAANGEAHPETDVDLRARAIASVQRALE